MERSNAIIRTYNYSDNHNKLLQQSLIKELNGLPVIFKKIFKGQAIYRCRKHDTFEQRFTTRKEISYRTDLENINSLGRCNAQNSSKLYGSFTNENGIIGYVTSIYETSPMVRDKFEGHELYTIGQWIAKDDFYTYAIKPNPKDEHILWIKELIDIFNNHFEDKKATENQMEFHELLSHEMSKSVHKDENHLYQISALFAEIILQQQVAMVYPSVQTESNGMNIVFSPESFDKYFELNNILIGDLFRLKNNSVFRNLQIVEDINSSPFTYRDLKEGEGTFNLDVVIQKLKEDGISLDYIQNNLIQKFNILK
jgi:hypothetical protein